MSEATHSTAPLAAPADPTGKIKASLALWLYLTTADAYTSWGAGPAAEEDAENASSEEEGKRPKAAPAPAPPVHGPWNSNGEVNSNLAALIADQPDAIDDMLERFANVPLLGPITTMAGAFSAVQTAFHTVMSAATPATPQPPYVQGHTCPPAITYLSQLVLSYPGGSSPAPDSKEDATSKAGTE